MTTFAIRLKEHVNVLGLSSAAAARQAGVEERNFHNYLSGRREPDFATLLLICERLNAEPNRLLGFEPGSELTPEQGSIIAAVGSILPTLSLRTLRSVSGIVSVLVKADRYE